MKPFQKVIKYIAIAFAISLIVTIVSTALAGFYAISGIFGLKKANDIKSADIKRIDFLDSNINTLEIDVNYTNLRIKKGNSLYVETNNTKIKCKQNNEKLEIKEEKHNWFFNNDDLDLTIYIPETINFRKVEINSGAGEINIERLYTEELEFELGAGKTSIENLIISRRCNINGGAGKVDVLSGLINNLDLDMGVGEVNISSILTGRNDIDAGVGNLNIDLLNGKENYTIRVNKGIGNVKVDGNSLSNGTVLGSGANYMEVDGGIGNIKIEFKQN